VPKCVSLICNHFDPFTFIENSLKLVSIIWQLMMIF
jgi:hypothetical protein